MRDEQEQLDLFFRSVGGVPIVQGDGETTYNFGVLPQTPHVMADQGEGLYDRFPALQGKWDGKSTVNHHDAVKKVLNAFLPAHQQPTGTCGGRTGSRGLEILECVLIASGKRAKFHLVSHAWPYFLARREYGMLGGGDGVPGGAVPPVLEKYGALNRDESGDLEWAGPSSDRLAGKWGAGQLRGEELEKMLAAAKDNIVTAMVKVRSAQELADGIASGGVGMCSDMQGYTMSRDQHGFCQPRGTWAHYHTRSGVRVATNGRKGFQYDQSWGDNVPSGPPVEGCPGNVFLVDWDVQDRLCRTGDVHVLFGFDLWDLEQGNIDIPWIFA